MWQSLAEVDGPSVELSVDGGMYCEWMSIACSGSFRCSLAKSVAEDGRVEQLELRQGHRNSKDFVGRAALRSAPLSSTCPSAPGRPAAQGIRVLTAQAAWQERVAAAADAASALRGARDELSMLRDASETKVHALEVGKGGGSGSHLYWLSVGSGRWGHRVTFL
eukprot:349923-Chlamydomonas_euryale.AAC.2